MSTLPLTPTELGSLLATLHRHCLDDPQEDICGIGPMACTLLTTLNLISHDGHPEGAPHDADR